MFSGIAPRYDLFNGVASLGLDTLWRKAVAHRIPKGARVLDLACGTGELALACAPCAKSVIGVDFSEPMLELAEKKASRAGWKNIRFMRADAGRLPFSDGSFDAVVSAFALRNVFHVLEKVHQELRRVLAPGGRVIHLEHTRPKNFLLRGLHALYLEMVMKPAGMLIFGARFPLLYLQQTINLFPAPEEFCLWMKRAGFAEASAEPLSGGIVTVFQGKMPC